MALQSTELVMAGLGVENDTPPNHIQPKLEDGIHLRWAFQRNKGFPWYGYYLFRRKHKPPEKIHTMHEMLSHLNLQPGIWGNPSLELMVAFDPIEGSIVQGHIQNKVGHSREGFSLSDDFPPRGRIEINLERQSGIEIKFYESNPLRWISVELVFRQDARIPIRALLRGKPVIQKEAVGRAGDRVIVELEFDAITAVQIAPGPAALVNLRCGFISRDDLWKGWQPLEGCPKPIRLPVNHPKYPCTRNQAENLQACRLLAQGRILYGAPNQWTARPPNALDESGQVSVVHHSPIVQGIGTQWTSALVGAVIEINGDATAYTILSVPTSDRLVLTRSYEGTTRAGVTYTISQDAFAQLHDLLTHLVHGGVQFGSMDQRTISPEIQNAGKVIVDTNNPRRITGQNSQWTSELVGLGLQIVGTRTKTDRWPRNEVKLENNKELVTGVNSAWTSDLAGMRLWVAGDAQFYTIQEVTNANSLTLDRKYEGETTVGKAYAIYDPVILPIARVISSTQLELAEAYPGQSQPGKAYEYEIVLQVDAEEPDEPLPRMPRLYPLDQVLMASLNPAVAQMLGLYWVDKTAKSGVSYDYLIAANYSGGGLIENPNLAPILEGGDGYIVFNKRVGPADPLESPKNLRAYALPGAYIPRSDQEPLDAQNNVGLKWDLGLTEDVLLPNSAIMYHLWRQYLGNGERPEPAVPEFDKFKVLTRVYDPQLQRPVEKPILVGQKSQEPTKYPANWPPFQMHTVDRALTEGWYAYLVSGIDIFGRHSRHSSLAQWYRWNPAPDPLPWYYNLANGQDRIDRDAVRVLDKVPPPPPAAVEAAVLDPKDPYVWQDAAYKEWRDAHPNTVGLRVSWLWTPAHYQQAPDTREFRVYFKAGLLNAVSGQIESVTPHNSSESIVKIENIPPAQSTQNYAGALLQVGGGAFKVGSSQAGTPLTVRVKSGPLEKKGQIYLTDESDIVEGRGTQWNGTLRRALRQTPLTLNITGESTSYRILNLDVVSQKLTLEQPYRGNTGLKAYTIIGKLIQPGQPCTLLIPPIYSAGTVELNPDSQEVKGTGTIWQPEMEGSVFQVVGESVEYQVKMVKPKEVKTKTQILTIEQIDPKTKEPIKDKGYSGPNRVKQTYSIRHPAFKDYGSAENWAERIAVVGYDEQVTATVRPGISARGTPLVGNQVEITRNGLQLGIDAQTPADLEGVTVADNDTFPLCLLLEEARQSGVYPITRVDWASSTISVEGMLSVGRGPIRWAIGLPVRKYEIFLEAPQEGLTPSLIEPTVYAQVGVSAVDGREHTQDWLGDPARWGNESRVAGPAKVFRIRREAAPTPEPLKDSEKVFATPADYHGHSFYTYRWKPATEKDPVTGKDKVLPLRCHIYRALDESVFQADWAWRVKQRQSQPPKLPLISEHDVKLFPVRLQKDTAGNDIEALQRTRRIIAEDLNHLNTFSLDAEGKRQAMEYYRKKLGNKEFGNDALSVLASFSWTESAFSQLTIKPLDPNDPQYANRVEPDNPADFPIDSSLRIYIDTLDGRTTNRYFYRAGFVDGANNRSGELSLSSPPVWLPNVVPPRIPVITKVLGGDRKVTLTWRANQEPGMALYLVYRTMDREKARDVRLMSDPIATVQYQQSARVTFVDEDLPGPINYYYRLVAVRKGEIGPKASDVLDVHSEPSEILAARTFDEKPPEPPTWVRAEWILLDKKGDEHPWNPINSQDQTFTKTVVLEWSSQEPYVNWIVQRKLKETKLWRTVSLWLDVHSGKGKFLDQTVSSEDTYIYRVWGKDVTGKVNTAYNERELPKAESGSTN